MKKEEICQYLIDRQESQESRKFYERDMHINFDFHRNTGKICAILGTRRSGKSTYLLQIAKELNILPKQKIWVDFTEYLWAGFANEDWKILLEAALELSAGTEPVFFLDEIQQVKNFESGLRYLQNQNMMIIITGSNSGLFHHYLSESLRGKVLGYDLYPLSFAEFLRFKNADFGQHLSSRQKAMKDSLFEEYLYWGGFPEVVLAEHPELKLQLVKSYIDTMLLRDVVERHEIKNFPLIEKLFYKVLLSFTKTFSVHRWFNDFKSQGLRVSKDTLYDYLAYLEESLFVHTIQNMANPQAAKKIYLVDNSLYQLIRDRPDKGKLWENACYLELLRQGEKPKFYLDEQGEIDFISNSQLIQVTLELAAHNTEREHQSFNRLAKQFPRKTTAIWVYPNFN